MSGMRFINSAVVAILFGLDACSLTPKYVRPETETSPGWRENASAADAATTIAPDWWTSYRNTELSQRVSEALNRNHDLRAALHRIEQARASAKVAGAGLYPSVEADGNATRKFSDRSNNDTTFNGQLSIAYEVDLWQRNRATLEAANARAQSSVFDRDALALLVMADTARTYMQVLNLRERRRIAQDNLALSRDVLRIVELRFREGAASQLEVTQQQTAVSTTEAALSAIERQQRIAEDALAILLGAAPAASSIAGTSLSELSLPAIAAGQPSSLLERRPDIRKLEADLIAANADIGVARAAFFPQLKLGIDPVLTANPGTSAISLAASLFQPIFEGGRLEGELERTRARQAELAENYRQTVLTSFQEVEDALVSLRTAHEREQALTAATDAARQAYNLSRERYLAGAIDFLTLLNAQSSQLQAEDNLAQARLDQFTASVDLYKALGGGWQP
jgi:NodT family efflux transporter outer membrane factor (OMF) lipoprotein